MARQRFDDASGRYVPDSNRPVCPTRNDQATVMRDRERFDRAGVPFEAAVQRTSSMGQRGVPKPQRGTGRSACLREEPVNRGGLASSEAAGELRGELLGIASQRVRRKTYRIRVTAMQPIAGAGATPRGAAPA